MLLAATAFVIKYPNRNHTFAILNILINFATLAEWSDSILHGRELKMTRFFTVWEFLSLFKYIFALDTITQCWLNVSIAEVNEFKPNGFSFTCGKKCFAIHLFRPAEKMFRLTELTAEKSFYKWNKFQFHAYEFDKLCGSNIFFPFILLLKKFYFFFDLFSKHFQHISSHFIKNIQ